jgi:hypothetical protein
MGCEPLLARRILDPSSDRSDRIIEPAEQKTGATERMTRASVTDKELGHSMPLQSLFTLA